MPGPCQPELHLLYLSLLYLDINIAVILKVTESKDYNGGFQESATDTHPATLPPTPHGPIRFIFMQFYVNQNRIQTKAKTKTTKNKETEFIISIKDEKGNIT